MTETSRQESAEVLKGIPQERSLERRCEQSEVIKVTETSRQESVEVVKSIPQERISERSGVIEVTRSRAGKVPRSSKVSLRSEVLNGGVNRARLSK